MVTISYSVFCTMFIILIGSAFFVTVRASTAYRKIWRLDNNFFARMIRLTVQKFQLFWVIFCINIFLIELWHILILWLAKMPNGGMTHSEWTNYWRSDVLYWGLQSKIKICVPENIVLQKKHCLSATRAYIQCLQITTKNLQNNQLN